VCRKHGISSASFYKWKAKYGGLEVSDAKRLKTLEGENAKLNKLLAEVTLDNAMLRDVASKKWRRPPLGARPSLTLKRWRARWWKLWSAKCGGARRWRCGGGVACRRDPVKLLGTNQASGARSRPSMKREKGRAEKNPMTRADATGSGSGSSDSREPAGRQSQRSDPGARDLLLEAAGIETIQMSGGDHEYQDHA
jgi:putative transposase